MLHEFHFVNPIFGLDILKFSLQVKLLALFLSQFIYGIEGTGALHLMY